MRNSEQSELRSRPYHREIIHEAWAVSIDSRQIMILKIKYIYIVNCTYSMLQCMIYKQFICHCIVCMHGPVIHQK